MHSMLLTIKFPASFARKELTGRAASREALRSASWSRGPAKHLERNPHDLSSELEKGQTSNRAVWVRLPATYRRQALGSWAQGTLVPIGWTHIGLHNCFSTISRHGNMEDTALAS